MNYTATKTWLEEHNITLEQSFTEHLRTLSKAYKKTTVSNY